MKTIVRKPLMIKINKLRLTNLDNKHMKKPGGHIGRDVGEITIKMKTIIREPLFYFKSFTKFSIQVQNPWRTLRGMTHSMKKIQGAGFAVFQVDFSVLRTNQRRFVEKNWFQRVRSSCPSKSCHYFKGTHQEIKIISILHILQTLPNLTAYKTHGCIRRTPIKAGHFNEKKTINIKRDEIHIMNIINDNTFNLHYSLLNIDNRYMKVTLKSKLIEVAK